ncbi:MAG TPA: metallophosphoesterase [Ohtaekwangia sp.]|nr:metallophosphoesterase [Ohtaekwangia sp.]
MNKYSLAGGLYFLPVAVLVASCSLFEYHPFETRLKESEKHLNAKAIKRIQSLPVTDTLRFILTGDTQRFYDETEDFVASANQQNVHFVIVAGDITDFGLREEFEWVHHILSDLEPPYIALIGNHDLVGAGATVFKEMYGPTDFSFVSGGAKFICHNTNSLEYDFNGKIPDLEWLQSELASLSGDPDVDKAFMVAHVPPYHPDFDPALRNAYEDLMTSSGKVKLGLYAHEHAYNDTLMADNIRCIVTTTVQERFYVVVKVCQDFYGIELVHF